MQRLSARSLPARSASWVQPTTRRHKSKQRTAGGGRDDKIGLIACGGWSRRSTLFGSDTRVERDDALLDPQLDAARIRAFFVDPAHARRGLGRLMLEHCEAEAVRSGFSRFELMATLPGKRLYERCGYTAREPLTYPLPGGERITFVPMWKALSPVR